MSPRRLTELFAPFGNAWPSRVAATALLATMAALMFTSIRDDVITVDEQAHIGAGYSYLMRADYRMNREHPPLMKDLAAAALLFRDLKVPWDHPSWARGDPYGFGGALMYRSGQDPDRVTRAARIPMILFTLGLGGAIYGWTERRFGGGAGLVTLVLYAFSPTFLAHGRLVTNDVGAAAGILFGTLCYVRLLRSPTLQNALLAGLVMGLAFLAKFSTSLLVVTTVILTTVWVMAVERPDGKLKLWYRHMALAGCVLVLAYAVVYVVYLHHTWHFPRRAEDVMESPARASSGSLQSLTAWAVNTRVLRPWGHFLVGLEQSRARVSAEQRPFFLGEYRKSSAVSYFPVLYLIKEPVALHVLTLVTLLFVPWRRIAFHGAWVRAHFTELSLMVVWTLYWTVSVLSPLQIGVRHVLPTLPIVYILVGAGTMAISARLRGPRAVWGFRLVVGLLLAWQAVTVIRVHPSYIAYFNEIAGGPDGGAEWAGDSNLDWGQDLKRLAKFVDARGIESIHLHYWGSAVVHEYLKGKERDLDDCSEPRRGWIAVSAFWYQQSRGKAECDYRRWLTRERLVTKIGYSIFVFHVD